MKHLAPQVFLLSLFFCMAWSKISIIQTPEELSNCFHQRRFHMNTTDPRYDNGHKYCVQKNRWHLQEMFWKNITVETSRWISELLRMGNKEARQKRQTLRRRVEYRKMSDRARANYHRAVNGLKTDTSVKPNRYDALGLLHQKLGDDVHHGAAFLGFHRVLLIIYENALRQKVPSVVLPYWDSRLDQPLRDPTRSIIWSHQFLGTNKGRVTNGPFAYWNTPAGPLVRNGGHEGELFTYRDILALMTRSHLGEISEPHAQPPFDYEIRHGDVHQFVGGTMAPAETAGFDPVFYMHHCFVDYIWEIFRRNQIEKGVNPTIDYPTRYGPTAHAPSSLMGLGKLQNIHGLSSMYTSRLYSYEPSPTCSYRRSDCDSAYLTCDLRFGRPRCVTLEMLETSSRRPPSRRSRFPPQAFPQRRQQQSSINHRPQNFGRRFGRVKRHVIDGSKLSRFGQNVLSQFGTNALLEFGMNKTKQREERLNNNQNKKRNNKQNNKQKTQQNNKQHSKPEKKTKDQTKGELVTTGVFRHMKEGEKDLIVSPVTDMCPSSSSQNVIQNTFNMNGLTDTRVWVYLPALVIYQRQPEQMKFESYPIINGSVSDDKDIYDPTRYSSLKSHFQQEFNHPRTCRDMDGIYTKVIIHSDGLNYHGTFQEFAVVDSRQPFAMAVVNIAVKNPNVWKTEVLLTAYDPCGTVCKPFCKRDGLFIPCEGSLKITPDGPYKMYGADYGDATQMVWKIIDGIPIFDDTDIFIKFVCK